MEILYLCVLQGNTEEFGLHTTSCLIWKNLSWVNSFWITTKAYKLLLTFIVVNSRCNDVSPYMHAHVYVCGVGEVETLKQWTEEADGKEENASVDNRHVVSFTLASQLLKRVEIEGVGPVVRSYTEKIEAVKLRKEKWKTQRQRNKEG